MSPSRRRFLAHTRSVLLGAFLGLGGGAAAHAVNARKPLPFYGGYGSAVNPDRRTPPRFSQVNVVWSAPTNRRLIALTFDDGPHRDWTPRVLSILERAQVPATFFFTGEHARLYGHLVAGRLHGHEVGNHTWSHRDLARMTVGEAVEELRRAHDELSRLCRVEPTLMRPPYGHLGGSTLLAANELGYQVVLWNRQMLESEFRSNPWGLVDYVVGSCAPGTILLAHDTGPSDRLIAIRGLAAMIRGLRARGFEFVTVSTLLSYSQPQAQAVPESVGRAVTGPGFGTAGSPESEPGVPMPSAQVDYTRSPSDR